MGREKANVRVVVRARPTANAAKETFKFDESTNSIEMFQPKDPSAGVVNHQRERDRFKLDRVLVNASQVQVFDLVAEDIVRSVMDGYNGTILCYGQTGAGKTHTMTGGHSGFADRGLVPRCITAIYQAAQLRPESIITVRLSYVEIYNELMFDLLTDVSVSDQTGELAIVEDEKNGIEVRRLSKPVAPHEEDALKLFFEGDTNRHVAEHALNKGSTRSHCVFTIYVEIRSKVESSEKVIRTKLHLVDLAGSERVKKSGSEGTLLKEATYINKSLTFLEQVVHALRNPHRDHVPYRQSKLTHMLKDSLGGNSKTTMIANVWPEASMFEETRSTLQFATRMMHVTNECRVNEYLDDALLIKKYEREIKDLKQELAMHDTLAGRSRQHYGEEFTPEDQRELESKMKKYLNGEMELKDIEIESLTMVYESFKAFHRIYKRVETELSKRPAAGDVAAGDGDGSQAGGGGPSGSPLPEGKEGDVGDDEEGGGISAGVAPPGSRPPGDEMGSPASDGVDGDDHRRASRAGSKEPEEVDAVPDKQEAFSEWKSKDAYGQELEQEFDKNRAELKQRKTQMKESLVRINNSKKTMDTIKEKLERKKAEKDTMGAGDEETLDEEEWALIQSLKECKEQYRNAYDQHKSLKKEAMQNDWKMQQCKQRLVGAFEDYFEQRYGHLVQKERQRQPDDFDGERYDPQEQFDLLEADRLEAQHPDALPYHKARQTATRSLRQKAMR